MTGRPTFVLGACGGVGASTVAMALALHATATGSPVIMMDADPDAGVMAPMAGVDSGRSGADLAVLGSEATADHVRTAAYPHPRAGGLVPAPAGADPHDLLQTLINLCDIPMLVVDIGSGPHAAVRLPAAAVCVFVVPRDAPGVEVARRTLEGIADTRRLHLVASDGPRRADISAAEVARSLGAGDLVAQLPHSHRAARSIATGHLPGRGAYTRVIEQLASELGIDAQPEGDET